jgi:hypothetical protein
MYLNGLSRNVSINMNRSDRDKRSFSDLPEGVSVKFLGIVPSDSGLYQQSELRWGGTAIALGMGANRHAIDR